MQHNLPFHTFFTSPFVDTVTTKKEEEEQDQMC